MNTAPIYRTRELSLATYIFSKGIKYLGPEKITENSYYFTFEKPDVCYKLESEFIQVKNKLIKSFEDGYKFK